VNDDALLAVCRTTHTRIMVATGGNVNASKIAIGHELERAGFELHEANEELTVELKTVFAALADGRTVLRDFGGNWQILRDCT